MSPAAPATPAAAGPGAGAHDVHLERLSLRVAGLDEDAACRLAKLVAEALTPGMLRPVGEAGPGALRVEVAGDARDAHAPDALAARIVDAIGRTVARDRTAGGPDGEAGW